MSTTESPFEKWGMPRAGVTPKDVAEWFAAQPQFQTDPAGVVGSMISAQDDWAANGGRNAPMVGFYRECEIRLRIAANSPFVPGGLPSADELALYGEAQ